MTKVAFTDYNKNWTTDFSVEKERILKTMPFNIESIIHIGSTSVPNLAAKPIIDILLEMKNVNDLDIYNKYFESIGYECMGEFGIKGRRFFRKGKNKRTHHIHAFNKNSYQSIKHIAFKEYLIAFPNIAAEYEGIKRYGYAICEGDIDKYIDAKSGFIEHHSKLALEWKKANA